MAVFITRVNGDAIQKAGIGLETSGPAVIHTTLKLSGKVAANDDVLVNVSPRFAGVVRADVPVYVHARPVYNRADLVDKVIEIRREDGRRRIVVGADVGGGDLGGFVKAVQAKIAANVELPPGVTIQYAGQYQNLPSATHRLEIVVPLALALIFGLLYLNLDEFKDALLVFSGVPLALTGGLLAVWLRGIALSITAVVGVIALSGVAVLNGLVMLTFINHRTKGNQSQRERTPNHTPRRSRYSSGVSLGVHQSGVSFARKCVIDARGQKSCEPARSVWITVFGFGQKLPGSGRVPVGG